MCVTTAIPRVNSTPVNAAPSTNPPHNMDHLQRLAHRLSLVDELFTTISQTNQSVQAPWDEIGPRKMQGNKELNKANKNTSRQKYVDGGKVQEKIRDQHAKTSKKSIHLLWSTLEALTAKLETHTEAIKENLKISHNIAQTSESIAENTHMQHEAESLENDVQESVHEGRKA